MQADTIVNLIILIRKNIFYERIVIMKYKKALSLLMVLSMTVSMLPGQASRELAEKIHRMTALYGRI